MVLIGHDKSISCKEQRNILQKHGVASLISCLVQGDYEFVEIETFSMRMYGLCCLGRVWNYLDVCIQLLDRPESNWVLQVKAKLERDVLFWKLLISDLVLQAGSIAVMRYYAEVNVNPTIRQINLSRLSASDLLRMEENETLIIIS